MSDMTEFSARREKGRQAGGNYRRIWRYIVAVLSVAVATIIRKLLDPYLHDSESFPTFYLVAAVVSWSCGWRPAVAAQILGYISGDWYFNPPRYALGPQDLQQWIDLAMYFAVTTTIIVLIHFVAAEKAQTERALKLAREKERNLETEMEARKALEQRLAKRGEELEQMVIERTARLQRSIGELESFSYSLTHDMRAPLRAMQSFAEMLGIQFAAGLPASGQDLLRRIVLAAARLDHLITDSLDYNKLMREEMALKPVRIATLLRGILETYPNLQAPQADISLECPDFEVMGSEAALTQCFSNLLGNAVKFVPRGVKPRVRIRGEPAPAAKTALREGEEGQASAGEAPSSYVRIWVEDNGIGIPREAHQRIFGMFQRMHRHDEYPGTGIGLAIAQKAVERMGGRMGVESEPGKGSRFWVELRKASES